MTDDAQAGAGHPNADQSSVEQPNEHLHAEPLRARVVALVAQIPLGRVVTYGQLAVLAGQPGAARQVGFIMNGLFEGSDLPWQRVINAQGKVSTDKLGFGDLQRGLLSAEGVVFDAAGRCDLGQYQWWPPDAPGQERLL